ncbi:MAG: Abi family protein [Prevotella sp.]|nr:Abi family protein [Prevotella sp.]
MRLLFDKSFMQPDDMVELLRHRGLEIENPQRVSHYIRNIGYYRLSAYMFPLLCQPKEEHCFKQGSKFQDALNLYRFDKKLRLFLFNEIEKVEIALRSTLANLVAEETGNIFWMTDETLFANSDKFRRTMENAISPMIPRRLNGRWIVSNISPKRIYYNICIIKWFIDIVSPNNDMLEHLQALLAEYPMIDIRAMGFPSGNWLDEPLWNPTLKT